MSRKNGIRGLIRHVYRAALEEDRWPAVLEQVADHYGAHIAGFHRRTPNAVLYHFAFARLDPEQHRAYREYYVARNPWIRAVDPLMRPGRIFSLEAILPSTVLRRTEFYDGYMRPAGVLHGLAACLRRRGDDVESFTIVRSPRGEPFDARDVRAASPLIPHLQRALQIHERLAHLHRTRLALADGLDQLGHGVVVVDGRGRLMFANRAARAIVAQRDGLSIGSEGLVATTYADRMRLRALLLDAVRTAAGEGLGAAGAMTVARPSLKRPFQVLVAPLRLALDGETPDGVATIFLTDPEERAESSDALMRRVYGLSTAEVRVSRALVAHGSLERAANELRLSRETARWHLKRIYRKTGTRRQVDLVRILMTGLAALTPRRASA